MTRRSRTRHYPIAPPSARNAACSAIRCRGSKTCRWSPAKAAMPATSTFRISSTCGWCAPARRTGGSYRSIRRPRGRCRAWSRCGPMTISPTSRRSIFAPTRTPRASANSASRRWRRTFVRYVGDPIAAVFAEDPYLAEDAADLVTVEIEELPVVMSASDPPGEFEPGRSSEAIVLRHSYGDIEAAFRNAHAVIELDLQTGRHSGVPLETRGAIGRYDAARDILELHGAAKIPHRNRETLVPHAQAQPIGAACAREPCRRRLRHPRRTLSRGCAGAGRRHAPWPAGEMDRGPARAPDVRQPGPPAAPPRPHRGRQGRPHPRHRGRDPARPGRLYPHPRRQRAEPHDVHADRLLQGAGLSRRWRACG